MTTSSLAVRGSAALFVLLATAATASAQQVIISTNTNESIDGTAIDRNDAVVYDAATGTVSTVYRGLGGDLDAFYLNADGSFLGSGNFNATLGSTTYTDEQVYRVDVSGDSLFFDVGTIGGTDVSGFDIAEDGAYIFSDRSGGTIGGITVADGDIVRYDPTSMTTSILVAQSALFDDGVGEISAIDLLPDGRLVLSASSDEAVSGTVYADGSLFIYDPTTDTASLLLDESIFDDGDSDIDAVFVVSLIAVPEPTSVASFGAAGLLLLARRRRA